MQLHKLLILACAIGVPPAAEASFIYEADNRALRTGYRVCGPIDCEQVFSTVLRPDPPFSDWSEALSEGGATVSQSSTLGHTSMTLVGSSSARPDQNWFGSSRANIDFSVSETSLFTVMGDLENVVLSLYRDAPSGQPILFFLPGEPIDFAGTLDTGFTYFLRVGAISFSNDPDESFDVTLSVVPIPEPGTAMLFVIGFAILSRRRFS